LGAIRQRSLESWPQRVDAGVAARLQAVDRAVARGAASGRPKIAKLAENERLRDYVQERLAGVVRAPDGREVGPDVVVPKGRGKPHRKDRRWAQAWSPEQIANRLKVDFPDDVSMRVSHEAIYQALYVESCGALKRELVACLRTGRACLEAGPSRKRGRM
jgi:hypothetical protein